MNNIIRNAFVVVSGLALAMLSLAGSAAGPTKQFSINVTQGALVGGGTSEFVLEIRNETPNGNSTINSMKVTLPGGFTIVNDGTHAAAFTTPSSGLVSAPNDATVIAISNLYPLKPQQALTLKFWANPGTAANCSSGNWTAKAWTGSSFSGDEFTQLTPAQVYSLTNGARTIVSSTTIVSDAALQFGSITSVVVDKPFDVTVTQTSSCGTSVTLPPASVTLNGNPDFTVGTRTTSGGSSLFTGNVFGTTGSATLTASAAGYASAVLNLKVFDGTLGCAAEPFNAIKLLDPTDSTFDSTNSFDQFATAAEGLSGYLFGARGPTDSKSDSDCTLVNYSVTNAIIGSSQTDPVGNTVPSGFYSFTFDSGDPAHPKSPVVGIVATFRAEWGDPDNGGLPLHKTLICNVELPTLCTTEPYDEDGNVLSPWKPAVACLSTLVQRSSIPPGEIGCVAFEQWEIVDPSKCDSDTEPETNPRCLKPTAIMIMGKDPVFGR